MSQKQAIGAALIAGGVLVVAYLVFESDTASNEQTSVSSSPLDSVRGNSQSDSEIASEHSIQSNGGESTDGRSGYGQSDSVNSESEFSDEVSVAETEWNESRGFFYNNEHFRYSNLSDDELKELSLSGDIAATQFLAARYTNRDPESAVELYEQAATGGSTYALLSLGNLWLMQKDIDDSKLQEEVGPDKPEFHALKYALVAELRRSNATVGVIQKVLDSSALTPSEISSACEEARQIYERMKQRRLAKGLPEFDNSPKPGTPPREGALICAP